MQTRSLVMPFRRWWLKEARDLLKADARNDLELAERFHRELGGSVHGVRSYLNRFKNARVGATLSLAEALCREYPTLAFPVMFFEADSEARAVKEFSARFREKNNIRPESPDEPPPPPVRASRKRKLAGTASEEFAALREKTRPQRP